MKTITAYGVAPRRFGVPNAIFAGFLVAVRCAQFPRAQFARLVF